MEGFAYYNEIDPFAVEWLWELIKGGHICNGVVDSRPIQEVRPSDLRGPFTQHHFFAGIGGWGYALRLAGWPDDQQIWTGSCPCQPFSAAGKRGGFADERHLWPIWYRLIEQCRPAIVAGEQVASPDGLRWFDLVSTDLENAGYAVGAADLCAAGVGAPHIRQRLYWLADREFRSSERYRHEMGRTTGEDQGSKEKRERFRSDTRYGEFVGELGHHHHQGSQGNRAHKETENRRIAGRAVESNGDSCGLAHSNGGESSDGELQRGRRHLQLPQNATTGFWSPADWIYCRDSKYRAVEPGTFPLAHGISGRVGRLRGYGNAIVPQVAATFIEAVMGCV